MHLQMEKFGHLAHYSDKPFGRYTSLLCFATVLQNVMSDKKKSLFLAAMTSTAAAAATTIIS